jgi:hypothetical protein
MDSVNNHSLVLFIATLHHKTAAKDWATNVESVESTNVATCLANGDAEAAKAAGHVVKLTIKRDGKGGVRNSGHKALRLRNRKCQNIAIYEIA